MGDKIKKNWQYCAFGVICGCKHANFWRNRDDYGLKRRVTVSKSAITGLHRGRHCKCYHLHRSFSTRVYANFDCRPVDCQIRSMSDPNESIDYHSISLLSHVLYYFHCSSFEDCFIWRGGIVSCRCRF